jgi:hypothetical protein
MKILNVMKILNLMKILSLLLFKIPDLTSFTLKVGYWRHVCVYRQTLQTNGVETVEEFRSM